MITSFSELVDVAREYGAKRIAIAGGEDREVLLAIKDALAMGIANPLLVGAG